MLFEAQFNRGLAAHQAGRLAEALAAYDAALALNVELAALHYNRGLVLASLGRLEEAEQGYAAALRRDRRLAEAHDSRAVALLALGRLDEAVAAAERAVVLKPQTAPFHYNRARILGDMGRREEALEGYARTLRIAPQFMGAHINRGVLQRELGRPAEALASYDAALALGPGPPGLYYNRGHALRDLGRLEEALANYDAGLAAGPADADRLNVRGALLHWLARPAEALADFDAALALEPDFAAALSNRGVVLQELGRLAEAAESYDAALALAPDDAHAAYHKGLLRLAQGDFEAGWPLYEQRWRRRGPSAGPDPERLWRGEESLQGRRLFISREQGLGDMIQFVRFVPVLEALGATVLLAAPDALRPLLASLSPTAQIVDDAQAAPPHDLHCPLMSLPLALGTTLETLPAPPTYLSVDRERRDRLEALLGPKTAPRIGLAWSGNPEHENDRKRSIAFQRLVPLLKDQARWIAVQNEVRPSDAAAFAASGKVEFLGPALRDFADAAALVDLTDLVITVDTSIAHLAGALGKPVWILLPFSPDWRWMFGRQDSPWYPSARLFRQPAPGDWESVASEVAAELEVRGI